MSGERISPFEGIESAHEYVGLLVEALEEADQSIKEEVVAGHMDGLERRLEALRIVEYKLDRLRQHLHASRRLLNDLRTLRRLLLGEREEALTDRPS